MLQVKAWLLKMHRLFPGLSQGCNTNANQFGESVMLYPSQYFTELIYFDVQWRNASSRQSTSTAGRAENTTNVSTNEYWYTRKQHMQCNHIILIQRRSAGVAYANVRPHFICNFWQLNEKCNRLPRLPAAYCSAPRSAASQAARMGGVKKGEHLVDLEFPVTMMAL